MATLPPRAEPIYHLFTNPEVATFNGVQRPSIYEFMDDHGKAVITIDMTKKTVKVSRELSATIAAKYFWNDVAMVAGMPEPFPNLDSKISDGSSP